MTTYVLAKNAKEAATEALYRQRGCRIISKRRAEKGGLYEPVEYFGGNLIQVKMRPYKVTVKVRRVRVRKEIHEN